MIVTAYRKYIKLMNQQYNSARCTCNCLRKIFTKKEDESNTIFTLIGNSIAYSHLIWVVINSLHPTDSVPLERWAGICHLVNQVNANISSSSGPRQYAGVCEPKTGGHDHILQLVNFRRLQAWKNIWWILWQPINNCNIYCHLKFRRHMLTAGLFILGLLLLCAPIWFQMMEA